jgi:hypothetical protein
VGGLYPQFFVSSILVSPEKSYVYIFKNKYSEINK